MSSNADADANTRGRRSPLSLKDQGEDESQDDSEEAPETPAPGPTTPIAAAKQQKKKRKAPSTDYEIAEFVREAHAQVLEGWHAKQKKLLQEHLAVYRDAVVAQNQLHHQQKNERRVFPRLLSNQSLTPPLLSTLYCQPCGQQQASRGSTDTTATATATATANEKTSRADAEAAKNSLLSNTRDKTSKDSHQLDKDATSSSHSAMMIDTDEDGETDDHDKESRGRGTAMSSARHRSNKHSTDSFCVRVRADNKQSKLIPVSIGPPIYLEGTHPPRPSSSATIFLKTHYATEDEQTLKYVPYFGDDDKEDVVSDLYNLEDRQKQMEFGAEYKERETNIILDQVLQLLNERLPAPSSSSSSSHEHEALQAKLHEALAELMDEYLDRIHQRYQQVILKLEPPASSPRIRKQTPKQSPQPPKVKKLETYLDAMDTYRPLFCRRCFTYDCNMHSNLTKPSLQLQGELAIQKERDGFWLQDADRMTNTDSSDDGDIDEEDAKLLLPPRPPREAVATITTTTTTAKTKKSMAATTTTKEPAGIASPAIVTSATTTAVAGRGGSVRSNITSSEPQTEESTRAGDEKPPASTENDLTPLQRAICERMFLIFQGDTYKMAKTMGAPQAAVAAFCQQKKFTLQEFTILKDEHIQMFGNNKKRKKGTKLEQSMNNYNSTWLKRVEDAEIHPVFVPCDHERPCDDETCSCIKNAFFCTKHCAWERRSRNFFRGCACMGKCTTKSCSCFAAKRECDPDLCKACGACTEVANHPVPEGSSQRCRNDNIGMRRHCQLLLGRSQIEDAGWGIFTRHALKKGDYVHEYVGEVISQEEAERRGRIYDKVNRSYLFNLSSDYVVDASRKGNKTRFANHSNKPNCYTKMVNVNGDIRIGLFAREDIEPQTELFFDYRYDVGMDNALIVKPGMTVDWMKDPKMANKISKKTANHVISKKTANEL